MISSTDELKDLILHSMLKEDFVKEYKMFCHEKGKTKELYLLLLKELKEATNSGIIENFQKLSQSIDYINGIENKETLKEFWICPDNKMNNTSLVILSCKHNKIEILKYIFNNTNILDNLSIKVGEVAITPNDEDEECHNAFYYAIRSCNVELLETLINSWPYNYFAIHLEELDNILSTAYEELKLKNISLSDEIEIFIEIKLISLRFFSDSSKKVHSSKDDFSSISKRIRLVTDNINLLNSEYSNVKDIDGRFLYIAKFIAQNIHVLKRQLKSTYDRLPWEEIEFCLITFVASCIKNREINPFHRAVLNKEKILNYLSYFAEILKDSKIIKDIEFGNICDLPKLKREKVVSEIINNNPQLEDLYKDYQQVRDIQSLDNINNYVKLALSADPKEKEGQLIITRVLQVIGEYFKNTLESPKLSSCTSDFLLLSLPKETRKIIIDLRNSLSHASSLSKRCEIEESADVKFFSNIQNDTKKVGNGISDILHKQKMKLITDQLKKIYFSENLDEIKEITEFLGKAELNDIFSVHYKMKEYTKLKNLIDELSNNISNKTSQEKQDFHAMNKILSNFEKAEENNYLNYVLGFSSLKAFNVSLRADNRNIKILKCRASKALKDISHRIEPHNLKIIAELSRSILNSVSQRIEYFHCDGQSVKSFDTKKKPEENKLDDIYRLIWEIFYVAEVESSNIKWIDELREKIKEKYYFIPARKQKADCVTEEQYSDKLNLKLSELKNILSKNSLNSQLNENYSVYKNNKRLQAVIEMLVLDIMSILSCSKKYLENNHLLIENSTPLLTGKCLRNHLAHYNDFNDLLICESSKAVLLNADKLASENIVEKKIGKSVKNNPFKIEAKFNLNLSTITNQEKMFVSLELCDLEGLKDCLNKGADINARNMNFCTSLHFAVKGSNLEIIKLIVNQMSNVNVKDVNSQSPLHVPAAYGRKDIVEYLLKEVNLSVNDEDNTRKTPLHIAAQNGHKNTVVILLQNKASTTTQDMNGFSPLYYAIRNCHIDIVEILLAKDLNVDFNEAASGLTPLHAAAESGHLELVNILLQRGANVNARNDRGWTPLHAAARDGYLEILNTLILKEAYINAKVINGCTPLYYAAESGHEEIVKILLKHGAEINAVTKTNYHSSLHCVARLKHGNIVRTLLNYKANASIVDVEGMTPLHFASENGHVEIVIALLKHGVDVNVKNKKNATPLHSASKGGHKDIVDILIKNKALVNDKTSEGFTPLYLAALNGNKNIICNLLENKAEIDAKSEDGRTALHAAAMSNSIDIINVLVDSKADINAPNNIGITPLCAAVLNNHKEVLVGLIKNKANVNTKNKESITPLYFAAKYGYTDIIDILMVNKAQINTKNITGNTPLHIAVEAGHKNAIELLIKYGADINSRCQNNLIPLFSAIKCNYKEIVQILIANGTDVNFDGGKALFIAVFAGYRDIVEMLLRNKACVNAKYSQNITLLHLAANKGYKEIVNVLVLGGANLDAINIHNETPLYFAAQRGHEDIVKFLKEKGACLVVKNDEGFTSLHVAAANGHINVVKLLCNKVNANIKDYQNRSPVELAVSYGHLEVVKELLKNKKIDVNAKGNNGWTLLHIAAQGSNLDIIKYLLEKGSNIKAKTSSDTKPIHIAAREGFKDAVELLLIKGCNVDELGHCNQTILHYAVFKGHIEVVKFLITLGADINAKDNNMVRPIYLACVFDNKDIIKVLLKNGAFYNALYNDITKLPVRNESFYSIQDYLMPSKMTIKKAVVNLIASTKKLFDAVKCNNISEVENSIKAGACVDSKNVKIGTPLHYAAWKGYNKIVDVLLQNNADVNAVDCKRYTPLHYAAKFSHLTIIKSLLCNGAMYNAVSTTGKTPLEISLNKSIADLLKLVDESFKNVENKKIKVIATLNNIKNISTVKAIMNASNREKKSLIVSAMHCNFEQIDQLKSILQEDISTQINTSLILSNQGKYQEAVGVLKDVLQKRKNILGSDNPGTVDIQIYIAKVISKQGASQNALNMLGEIFQKQKDMLGLNNKDTLSTRSLVALILHDQGKDKKALDIFQEVYQKQKDILGLNHADTVETQLHMALVLDRLEKYEEALILNQDIYLKNKKLNLTAALLAQNNIAVVLFHQRKYDEALKIYKEVLEKKKDLFGMDHSDTLRTRHNIAAVFSCQKNYSGALRAYKDVLSTQKRLLGPYSPDTLDTQYNIATVLFTQGKYISALKDFQENLAQRRTVLGSNHPTVLDISRKIEIIKMNIKMGGSEDSNFFEQLKNDISVAASKGDMKTIENLLKYGDDINDRDANGITPLHFAVYNRYIDIVKYLLENGADVAQVTIKGNTPLHIAASKGYEEIVEILLQYGSCTKLNHFINAQTTVGRATALHIAAKNGFLNIVLSLFKHGAIYNTPNKEGNTAFNLTKNKNIINLLKLIEELFEDTTNKNVEIVSKLKLIKPEEFSAVTSARNSKGNTLLQVAIANKHTTIAGAILEMLKKNQIK